MHTRPLEEKDAPLMLEWMHSEDVVCYLANDFQSMKLEDCLDFIRGCAEDKDNYHLAICDDCDEYLGTVSLKHIDRKNQNAEYAISTREKAHGTGAAQYGTKAILDKAFGELGLHRVYLNVIDANQRADRFYQKMGFHYEGMFSQHLFLKDRFWNLKWYAITKEEYLEK
ncbi:MAG: GNAT family protein [Lachnospiraceae bacterium]|nr:GNAT family protein [Lachnospiraceae bacterium]